MKYLAACTLIAGCIMLANPAFAGDTRIIINTDLGLFDHSHSRHYDRHHDHRPIIVHRAPRVIYSPFGDHRHNFWHDNGRHHDRHWKGKDHHHDNRRHRDHHGDRHDRRDRGHRH